MNDESLRPKPDRILCVDGVFTSEATDQERGVYSEPRDFTPQPKFQYVALGDGRPSERSARERITRRVSPTKTKKPRRMPAPRHRKDITIERIRELQALGLSILQIARELGCYNTTVNKRLKEGK